MLLVGDGHFDYKDIYGYGEPNYIPPYLDDVDPWVGETATDNRYVSISGGDILPDMYVGRFPVRSAAEAQTMAQKVIQYEQSAQAGEWNSNLTFLADNPDSGGNFYYLSNQIIARYVTAAYKVEKIYYDGSTITKEIARMNLQAAINRGSLLVHYVGHGSVMQWANEGFLKVEDLVSLTNSDKMPFFLPMTCSEGYFIWPSQMGISSLGESVVRIHGKGAIASWSPTGYGMSSGHDYLDQSLMKSIFVDHKTQLGYATTQAKYYLFANSSGYSDLIETYVLFGDPALRIKTPSIQYIPIARR